MYYLKDENNNITAYCEDLPEDWANYFETEENIVIVSDGVNGDINMLQSDFDVYSQTNEYIQAETFLQNKIHNNQILEQIIKLELKQPRAIREFVLNVEGSLGRLQDLENQIATLRGQLVK